MRRNKLWANQLLDIVVDNDQGGGGLFREEIRRLFAGSDSGQGFTSEELWEAVDYHLHLLVTAGFLTFTGDDENNWDLDNFQMTWAGHEYIGQ